MGAQNATNKVSPKPHEILILNKNDINSTKSLP